MMRDDSPETRRIRERFPARLEVRCRQASGARELEFTCFTRDISEFGMQIITDEKLDQSKSVLLDLALPYPSKKLISAIGRIRWHRKPSFYGVSFEEISAESREALFKYLFFRSENPGGSTAA
jgi:c-di-GMP-binding flagellar brake protein YcgR